MKNIYPSTPIPYAGESAGSFILRLIQLNSYQHPAAIYRNLAGIKTVESFRSTISHHDKFENFLSKMKLGKDNYKLALIRTSATTRSEVFWGNTLLAFSFFQSDLQYYCPLCLKEKEFWKKDWLLSLNYACRIHEVKLLNKCPTCLKKLDLFRAKISICNKCQTDIRNVSAQPCESMYVVYWMDSILNNSPQDSIEYFKNFWSKIKKFNDKNKLGMSIEELGVLSYKYFFDMKSFQKSIDTILLKKLSHLHPRISLMAFSTKDTFSQRYKNFIQKSSDNYVFPIDNNTSGLLDVKDCIKILQVTKSELQYLTQNSFLKTNATYDKIYTNSVIAYLLKEISFKQILKKALIQEIEIVGNPEFYTIPKAAILLKVNYETVRFLIKDGILLSIRNESQKTNSYFIKKYSLYDFHKEKIVVGALAKELQVNPRNLTEKLAALDIYPINGPKVDHTRNNIFLRSSLKNLTSQSLKDIKMYITSSGRKSFKRELPIKIDESYVTLKEASIILGKSHQQVAQLASHNILAKKKSYKGQIFIDKKTLKNISNKIRDPMFIHRREVLRLLNCPANWFDEYWIKTGLLEVENLLYWQLIPYEQVQKAIEIKREYLTGIEASKLMGMHKSHISNLQTQGLIKPHFFGNKNKLKLYKKTDVLELIKNGYGHTSMKKIK